MTRPPDDPLFRRELELDAMIECRVASRALRSVWRALSALYSEDHPLVQHVDCLSDEVDQVHDDIDKGGTTVSQEELPL